jgi:hypothetical protein
LFAALEVATGKVLVRHDYGRRRAEFLDFMNQVIADCPEREIRVIIDNLSTHKPKRSLATSIRRIFRCLSRQTVVLSGVPGVVNAAQLGNVGYMAIKGVSDNADINKNLVDQNTKKRNRSTASAKQAVGWVALRDPPFRAAPPQLPISPLQLAMSLPSRHRTSKP